MKYRLGETEWTTKQSGGVYYSSDMRYKTFGMNLDDLIKMGATPIEEDEFEEVDWRHPNEEVHKSLIRNQNKLIKAVKELRDEQ